MRILIAVLSLLSAALHSTSVAANTAYFFEGIYSGGRSDITDEDRDVRLERTTVDLTINLGSVNTANMPYSEAAFLNRSSFLRYRQTSLGSYSSEASITTQTSARLVIDSGLYLAAIEDTHGEDETDRVIEIQLGQFTSTYTGFFAGYVIDDSRDADVYTAGVHTTSPSEGGNTWMAYDFGGKYSIEGDVSTYAVNLGMTYYPSLRSALGFQYEYADDNVTKSHETQMYGEYYFSNYLSTRLDATLLRHATTEEQSAALSLKLRF